MADKLITWCWLIVGLMMVSVTEGCFRRRRPCPPRDMANPRYKRQWLPGYNKSVHANSMWYVRPVDLNQTKPVVYCPKNIVQMADYYQVNAMVTWNEPVLALDNNDGWIRASRCGPPPRRWYSTGTTWISYYAYDRSGNKGTCKFSVTVYVATCSHSVTILNGYFFHHPAWDFRYGSYSKYQCHRGYNLVGHNIQTCEKTVTGSVMWTPVSPPTCQKVTCSPEISGTSTSTYEVICTAYNNYKSVCTYQCKSGFTIKQGHSNIRVCSSKGHWLGEEPTCVDLEPPEFESCPHSVVAYTEKGSNTYIAQWRRPTATDNSGETINVQLTKGVESGTPLAVGTHKMEYSAVDSSGNVARPCTFTIFVRRLRCHTIYPTPYLQVTCEKGYAYGESCSFTCESGKVLTGVSEATCEKRIYGSYYTTYWTWGNEMPSCQAQPCAALTPPINGALACDKWLYGKYCKMFCNRDYDIAADPAILEQAFEMFVCESTGKWNKEKPPDCLSAPAPVRPRMLIWLHYFTGDCCETSVQDEIRDNFIKIFKFSEEKQFCNNYPGDCVVDNVEVVCSGCTNRGKRSVSGGQTLTLKAQLSATVNNASTGLEAFKNASAALQDMANSISGTLSSNSSLLGNGLELQNTTSGQIEFGCSNGTKPSYNSFGCVPACQPGFYLNSSNGDCVECAEGYYYDSTDPNECKPCPANTTSIIKGATSVSKCLAFCTPGSFSAQGLAPCTPCSIGTYTDGIRSTLCNACSKGTTTENEGSSNRNQCQSYNVITSPSTTGSFGTISQNITTSVTTSLAIAFKILIPDDNTTCDVFQFDDEYGTFMSFKVANIPEIKIRSCTFMMSTSLNTANWNSLMIQMTLNTINAPQINLNNQQISFSTSCSATTTSSFGQTLSLTFGSLTETVSSISISDFNVWNGLLSTQKRQEVMTTCSSTEFGDVISWADIPDNMTFVNSSIEVPSGCDLKDDCERNPCGNTSLHSCTDQVNGYKCVCHKGFTGTNCETDVDDCMVNLCVNNATCVDGYNNYTCICQQGFRGEFCDDEIVNGGWSLWSDWSTCTASCNGGIQYRNRSCDQPQPDPDGIMCIGDSLETQNCSTEECPVCTDLKAPENGSLQCDYDGVEDMTNCTVLCDDGFAFSIEPLNYYSCGFLSNYSWSADDESLILPKCTAISPAKEVSAIHTVQYKNDRACTKESKDELQKLVDNNLQTLPCIINNQCRKASLDITGCSSSQAMVFVLKLSLTGLSSSVAADKIVSQFGQPAESLVEAATLLYQMVSNGNFTVNTLNSIHYVQQQGVQEDVQCEQSGYTWLDYYCMPCQKGYYEANYICVECPQGTYQEIAASTQCTPCPSGYTTSLNVSQSKSDCNVPCQKGYYIENYICVECPQGTYQENIASTQCTPCPSGYTTLLNASQSKSDCNVPCQKGYYIENYICVECPQGTYQENVASAQCNPCPSGYTTLSNASQSKSDCNVEVITPKTTTNGIISNTYFKAVTSAETLHTAQKQSGSSNTGAIVGGLVVVVLVLIVVIIVVLYVKNKTCQRPQKQRNTNLYEDSEQITEDDLQKLPWSAPAKREIYQREKSTFSNGQTNHINQSNDKLLAILQNGSGSLTTNDVPSNEKKPNVIIPVSAYREASTVSSVSSTINMPNYEGERPATASSITIGSLNDADNRPNSAFAMVDN